MAFYESWPQLLVGVSNQPYSIPLLHCKLTDVLTDFA